MILALNPHKIFYVNGNRYLLISGTGAIFELDDATAALIEQNGRDMADILEEMKHRFGMSRNDIEKTLNEFHEVNLLGFIDHENDWIYSLEYLRGIELMVCQCCNLACRYCYATEGEYQNPGWMTEKIGKKAIDFLFAHSLSPSLSVSFFGGEPLLNFELIKVLVEYTKKLALNFNKSVSFSITTNGTLIDDNVSEFLQENHFYISLSIDGTKANHNSCRVNKVGQGSYDDSINKIHSLANNRVTLRATSTPKNCDYVEIANALYALRQSEFFITEAMNCYCTNFSLKKVEHAYECLLAQFFDDINAKNIQKCKANLLIYSNLKKIAHFKKRSSGCAAFICAIAVDIDGNIYPCHRFVGSSYCIGSVLSEKFDIDDAQNAFERDFLVKNRKGCSECWAQNLCAGGCSYLNFEANGACYLPSASKCRLTLYLLEKLVSLYLMLTSEQKKMLGI